MNKLIFKNTIKFFLVSSILLLVSVFLKMLNVDHADFILNISFSVTIISLIAVMMSYKTIRGKNNFSMD